MKGKWIWVNENVQKRDCYGEFQQDFVWNKGKVFLDISADSEYAVFINEKFVYGGQYADFPWYKIYDRIEITKYLRQGKNTCKILVWYSGCIDFTHYVNKAGVCFDIVGENTVYAYSNETTLSRQARYFVNGLEKRMTLQIGYTFTFDYTLPLEEFTQSVLVSGMPSNFYLRPISLLKILPLKKAVKIGDGIYDLGEETVGFPYLKLKAPKGEKITISFGEWLKDGKVPRLINGRDFSYHVVANGDTCTVFNPLRKLGCRYFEVEGKAEIEEIGLLPLIYPFEKRKNKFYGIQKQIYDVAVRTLELNALEHYYDCPWREQGFYALDSRMQMRYGYIAFRNTEYQKAALKLMSEDRNSDGFISIVVPTSDKLVIPSFALFYIVAMEEYATTTGDTELIKEYYEKLKRLLLRFVDNMNNGLIENMQGEQFWNFYEWNKGLAGTKCKVEAGLNFTFLLASQSFIKICRILKKEIDMEYFSLLNEKLRQKINEVFFDKEKKLYKAFIGSERDYELINAYAILTETAKAEDVEYISSKLLDADSGLVPCTLSMLPFKYDALLKTNKEKYKAFILADIDEKFSFMLKNGATSFWETLKGSADFDGAGSLCHGWSAFAIYYYSKLMDIEESFT